MQLYCRCVCVCVEFGWLMSEAALRRSALARENVTQVEFGQTVQASLRKSWRRWPFLKQITSNTCCCNVFQCLKVLPYPGMPRVSIFPLQSQCYGFQRAVPASPQNLVRDAKCPWFFQVIKIRHFWQFVLTFWLFAVGKIIYRSRTAISHRITARHGRGRGRCVG